MCLTGFASSLFAQTDEFNLDQTYSIDSGGTITLSSDDADVWITGSDRDNVHVIIHYKFTVRGITFGESNEFEMIVEEQGGDLSIRENEREFSTGMIGYSNEEYTIEIQAPRDVNLALEGDDEEYEIAGIDGFIHLDADDSDATISDVNGKDFSFSIDDGSLEMVGGSGRLRIQADDGEIQIHEGDFTDVEADSDDSDIEITTSLYDAGDYSFDLDDGDLTLNITGGGGKFDIHHDGSDISTSGEFESIRDENDHSVYLLSGGDARIIIHSDDGDINLRVY